MPWPVSETVTTADTPQERARSTILPPLSSMASSALPTMFANTWRSEGSK